MPNASTSDPDVTPQATSVTSVSGGINIDAQRVAISGDLVAGSKIIGYTVEQVQALFAQITAAFQPKPFDGRCPYLGLDAFGEDDADRFFGRETLIAELIERVKTARFLVIAGPSGSGKSSLVRAGLVHQLKQGALPTSHSDHWLYATLTPGRDPIESLALAVSRLKSPDLGDYLRQHATDPDTLHKCAESALSDLKDQRAVIFVDQFEEVFTQVSKESDRVAFLNLLATAASREDGRVTVLFALRSDFVANCATYPQLNTLLNQQFLQVGAMQADELVSAIARPALQVGLRIDPDLVKQIVDDMGDEPGALPLMQFALKDLFDAEQAKGGMIALTLSDYLARGGLRQSLERHADAAFAKLSPNEQQLARSIFSGLIEIGSGREDTRRTTTFDELVPANGDATLVESVVQKLADARLITTDEQDRKEIVTISHEKLIDAWPWLRKLIDDNREAIALQNQIAEDAQEWDRSQRDASYLYIGARLANAREQLAAQKIGLSELAQTFVEAGIQAEQNELEEVKQRAAQLRRGTIYLAGALGLAVLLGIIAGIFGAQSNQTANTNATLAAQNASIANTAQAAGTQAVSEAHIRATAEISASIQRDEAQRQARIAFSRQLAAQALAHLSDQLDLTLLLSIEAYRAADTTEAYEVFSSALEHSSRLETYLNGHNDQVSRVAFSPDDKTLASGSADKTIILWDVSNPHAQQQLGQPLTGHSDYVTSVAFSPDGKTLASGSADRTIILWDVSNPQAPKPLGRPLAGHGDSVLTLAFSPNGKMLASGSADKTIILWDVSNPQVPKQLGAPLVGHSGAVRSVAFYPDGRTLASGSEDKTIILWDVSNLQAPQSIPLIGHTDDVTSVAFSPDGQTLASGSADRTIILWDVSNLRSPKRLYEPLTNHTSFVWSVAFSPDGKTLASASEDKTIILWDVSNPRTPQPLGQPLTGHTDYVTSVAFSPDGKTLASGSADKTIILWDVSNPHTPPPLGQLLTGSKDVVWSVVFSPDSKTLASGSCGKVDGNGYCTQGEIILWNVSDPQTPKVWGPPLTGHTDSVRNVAFSPDGKTLASGSADNTIVLWDTSNPQASRPFGEPLTGHSGAVSSVAFSPDGKTLASGSCGKIAQSGLCSQGQIILWDVSNPQTPKMLGAPLTGHTDSVRSVAFSPDGKTLATGSSDGTIILWDVSNRQAPVQLGVPLTGPLVTSVVFSPSGKTLASGSFDGLILLWDVSNRQAPVQLGVPLTGHTGYVSSVTFSPDGRMLASGGADETIILWDVSNLQAPQRLGKPLTGHTGQVMSVAFSPDGKTLASSDWDKKIIVWDVDPISWQSRACQMAGRNLTRAEWVQYMGDELYRKTCEQWPAGE